MDQSVFIQSKNNLHFSLRSIKGLWEVLETLDAVQKEQANIAQQLQQQQPDRQQEQQERFCMPAFSDVITEKIGE